MSAPDPIIIRPMSEADLDAVLLIEQASYSRPWKREHFQHEIVAPHSYPFVVECGGGLAGFVCLSVLFEVSQILDIAVASDQRGRGIGLALMEFAIDQAGRMGADVLELEVRSTNTAAITLYERLGFIRSGCRSKYYEGKDDALLMELKLK